MKSYLKKLIKKEDLSKKECYELFIHLLEGKIEPTLVAAILVALNMKGESLEEIEGAVEALMEKAIKITGEWPLLIDTCGTGGDMSNSFNISTTVAFVLAANGIKVAKHGNRSLSSKCGSVDLLEALGVNISAEPQVVIQEIEKVGIGFMFAPLYHPTVKNVAPIRKTLGIRTIFNIIGPLCNPAPITCQFTGTSSEKIMILYEEFFKKIGREAIIVHGNSGMDEIDISDSTTVVYVNDNTSYREIISPEKYGLPRHPINSLKVKGVEESKEIFLKLINGEEEGAIRDAVVLNSAFGLKCAKKVETIEEGIRLASETLKSKKIVEILNKLIEVSNQ